MTYECVWLMGNQLLEPAASEGTGPFGDIGQARSGAGARAMPGVHRSAGALAAEAFPEGHPLPGVQGEAHAHRSDFSLQGFPVTLVPDFALGVGSYSTARGSGFGKLAAARPASRPFSPLPGSGCGPADDLTDAYARAVETLFQPDDATLAVYCEAWARGGAVIVAAEGDGVVAHVVTAAELFASGDADEKRTPSALRAPGDFSRAGAPALVRAPALPRGMRAALTTEQADG